MDRPEQPSRLTELYALVSLIPRGRATSYSALGRALTNPVSGFLVGKWMAVVPEGVPWWRVVKADGEIALFKRDPVLGTDQMQRLKAEGIPFLLDHQIDMDRVFWNPDGDEPA